MTLEIVRNTLGWCGIMNIGLLLFWFVFIAFAHDFVYRMHSKWFTLSIKKFDAIHYGALAFFKAAILMFNIVPYLALRIVG